jgi:chromosome segregation ATPase
MDQQSQETSEVLTFAPRQGMCDPIDQAGQALVGMLKDAAALSQQNVERAMTMAHQLSMQLRASEDRIQQLESEIENLESRASSAEGWLQAIKQEIEDKLLCPIEARRPELPALH